MRAKIKPRIQLDNRESLADSIPLKTPWVIFVDPSDLCNFNCKFCPSGDINAIKKVGRNLDLMDFNLYKKIINDICEFENPIKVLRLYKDGEPLLNPNFSKMVKYAKNKNCCYKVDTTTNGSMLSPERNLEIIGAGLDRINISVEGINEKQYLDFSNYNINFDKFVSNIAHFYDNRKQCEVMIKINGDLLSEDDKQKFYHIFGDIADGIFIEHTMSCWYGFDMKDIKENDKLGLYGQPIKEVIVCPYVFYSISVNSNGTVSLCFLDWARKLSIENVKYCSLKEIWNGKSLYNYRKMFLEKKRKEHPICGKCSQLTHGLPVDLDDKAEMLLKKMII